MPKGLLRASRVLLVGQLKFFLIAKALMCALNSLPMERLGLGHLNSGPREADFNTVSLLNAGSQGLELRRVKKVGSLR